jgi:lipid-binding SYLF domain-containing protein
MSRNDIKRVASACAVVLALFVGLVRPAIADEEDERQRVRDAAQVLREITRADDKGIPAGLFERAKAIAVFPHVVRGAFIVGGRWGKGVVVARDAKGSWGPAGFLDLGGGSFGFQIGGDATDVILFFIEEDGIDKLLEDKVELGANASVAAGPVGRSAEVGTNLTLDAAIYAYSRSKGVFAGVALDGTVITLDNSANENAYGREIKRQEVLNGNVPVPAIFAPYVSTVKELTPATAR